MPDCGHVPQVERPHETSELLMDFFARAEQRANRPPASVTPLPRTGSRAA
jgi:hypothetical protein